MDIKKEFLDVYGIKPDVSYYSPGRVNLIGEHIDYNGGLVFPAAISLGTYGAVKVRKDQVFRFHSDNFKELGIIQVSLNALEYDSSHEWTNYVKGVLKYVNENYEGVTFGFDLEVNGTLPPASGLSSSASLQVLVAYICNDLYDLGLTREKMALIAQHVENNYMGMHCGIMDQLIIAKGIKNKALLMNTATLETTPVDAFFEGYTWVIMNSNYKRKTTESKYNERVRETKEGLRIIQQSKVCKYLCDLTPSEFDEVKNEIKDDVILRRIRHVINEQQRVLDSKVALSTKDAIWFGRLLNESHQSLKDDYEVTGFNLDSLTNAARTHKAIGARVTGAGFGGCAIALVKNEDVNEMIEKTKKTYYEETKTKAEFYLVEFTDGVSKL
jgi:galactokinase